MVGVLFDGVYCYIPQQENFSIFREVFQKIETQGKIFVLLIFNLNIEKFNFVQKMFYFNFYQSFWIDLEICCCAYAKVKVQSELLIVQVDYHFRTPLNIFEHPKIKFLLVKYLNPNRNERSIFLIKKLIRKLQKARLKYFSKKLRKLELFLV